jgi:hypothetical protein
MFIAFAITWMLVGVYAVVGNFLVYAMLVQRQIPVQFLWASTPGYLVRVCSENASLAGTKLLWFARSTVVALFVCLLLSPILIQGR